VTVDRVSGIAEVEPGARLADIDNALCPLKLVIPTGTVSETGVAGLTLGGGIGWLLGRYGLTCDQLIGADVVLADGRLIKAECPEHSELLWALRGGGGNFGVVTRFRYRTNFLPSCIVGSCILPLKNAASTLERLVVYLDNSCPRQLTVAATLTRDHTNRPTLSIDFCLSNSDEITLNELLKAIGHAQRFIQKNAHFPSWQRAFDHVFQPPMRGYWKAKYGRRLTRIEIDAIVLAFESAPAIQASILIEHLHGAFADTDSRTSSFPLRWARFGILFSARWKHALDDRQAIAWVQDSLALLDPSSTSATYSNYAFDDDARALGSFPAQLAERLREVKTAYDPYNLFRRNHNIHEGSVTSTS